MIGVKIAMSGAVFLILALLSTYLIDDTSSPLATGVGWVIILSLVAIVVGAILAIWGV